MIVCVCVCVCVFFLGVFKNKKQNNGFGVDLVWVIMERLR